MYNLILKQVLLNRAFGISGLAGFNLLIVHFYIHGKLSCVYNTMRKITITTLQSLKEDLWPILEFLRWNDLNPGLKNPPRHIYYQNGTCTKIKMNYKINMSISSI